MAANPERGEVDLIISRRTESGEPHPEGDRAYILRMRTHDICVMEARTQKTFGQVMDDLVMKSWSAMRECLFTFLQSYHSAEFPDVGKVNALLDEIKYDRALELVTDLIMRNKPPKVDKSRPRKAQAGTGTSSTRADAGSA